MSYCRKRLSEATSSMISSACFERVRKNPGMSIVLIGSISSLMPASLSFSAANLRLATNDARGLTRNTALALRPIAGRHVEQYLHEVVLVELLGDLVLLEIIGPEIFDS